MEAKNPQEAPLLRLATVMLFLVLTIFGVGFSVYLFITASNWNLLALSLLFIALSVITGLFNLYAAYLYYKSYFYKGHINKITASLKPLERFPTVAIAVPVYNEEPKAAERNLKRLLSVNYPKDKLKLYVLDDSSDQKIAQELSEFSKRHGLVYLHRSDRSGFKAGAFNNMFTQCKEEFVAIFDSDEYLTDRNFLMDLLPYFSDKSVGYVQTQKTMFESKSLFSNSIKLFDGFFFTFIEPARALSNTAIFAGSCGIIRRSVLDETGGFPVSVIEDTFFSFESDLRRYKSLYIPKVYAYGRPIDTFTALVRQQWRYNYGDTQFISYFLRRRKAYSHRLPPISNVHYIMHGFGLNYLSITLILFTITSVLIAFSSLPLLHLTVSQVLQSSSITTALELFGGAAFALSVITPALLAKLYFKSLKKGLMVFALNFALAVARAKAAFAAMLDRDPGMHWHRVANPRRYDVLYALRNTTVELVMALGLLAVGVFAMFTSSLSAGFWLLWYGAMYMSAPLLLYKYG